LLYLPPYCSELNPIEKLWAYAKHYWKKEMVDFRGDLNENDMRVVIDVICQHMSKYNIKKIINHVIPLMISSLKYEDAKDISIVGMEIDEIIDSRSKDEES
jgi:hypothetical protein